MGTPYFQLKCDLLNESKLHVVQKYMDITKESRILKSEETSLISQMQFWKKLFTKKLLLKMRKKINLFRKFICTKNLQEICANICPDLIEKSVPIIKKPAVGERQTPWKLAWRRITHWSYKIHLKNICNWILFLQNTYSLVFLLISNFSDGLHLHHFLIAPLARSDPRNHFSVQK